MSEANLTKSSDVCILSPCNLIVLVALQQLSASASGDSSPESALDWETAPPGSYESLNLGELRESADEGILCQLTHVVSQVQFHVTPQRWVRRYLKMEAALHDAATIMRAERFMLKKVGEPQKRSLQTSVGQKPIGVKRYKWNFLILNCWSGKLSPLFAQKCPRSKLENSEFRQPYFFGQNCLL